MKRCTGAQADKTTIEINRTNNFLISFLFFDLHNRYLGDISALFILRLYDDNLDNRFFSADMVQSLALRIKVVIFIVVDNNQRVRVIIKILVHDIVVVYIKGFTVCNVLQLLFDV